MRDAGDEIVALTKTLGAVFDAVLEASLPGGSWGDTMVALADAYDDGRTTPARGVNTFRADRLALSSESSRSRPPRSTRRSGRWIRRRDTAIAWNPSLRRWGQD